MTTQDRRRLLEALCLAPGPPGREDAVRDLVRDALDGVGSVAYDRLGSLVCELPGSDDSVRVAIDSHLDEVGFMVQSVHADGHPRRRNMKIRNSIFETHHVGKFHRGNDGIKPRRRRLLSTRRH